MYTRPKTMRNVVRWLKSYTFVALIAAGAACAGHGTDASNPPLPGYPQAHPNTSGPISVDLRGYVAATVGGTPDNPQNMLCTEKNGNRRTICITGLREGNPHGEVAFFYDRSYGAVNHVAISSWYHGGYSYAPYYIGTIRNFTGTGSNGSILRCFSTWLSGATPCTAPANSFYMPAGVPYKMNDLPVVGNDAVVDASNSDGSPKQVIAGAFLVTKLVSENNYWAFATQQMSASCAQHSPYGGSFKTRVFIVYAKNVPFGGTPSLGGIGTLDAVVIDAYSPGYGSSPAHVERTFYVSGLGSVMEGTAEYDNATKVYDLDTKNIDHSDETPLLSSVINYNDNPEPKCPQGSYLPLWGY